MHSVNLAHAYASNLYRTKYQSSQGGKIGITLSVGWSEPATDSEADKQASDIALQFDFSAWADPIWFGDYPAVMRENCGDLLPRFSEDEKRLLKGSSDFQGVNFYTASYVSAAKRGKPGSGWYVDRNASNSAVAPNGTVIGQQADSPWLYIVPWGLHKMLNWIGRRYGSDVQLVVTENGMDVVDENKKPLKDALHDTDRIAYLSSYIAAMGDSISDGTNVIGYFLWSLMDNYEVKRPPAFVHFCPPLHPHISSLIAITSLTPHLTQLYQRTVEYSHSAHCLVPRHLHSLSCLCVISPRRLFSGPTATASGSASTMWTTTTT